MGLTRIRAEQISDIDYKQAVRVITISGVTLDGGAPRVVDGITLVANDRVLVTGQAAGSENGLYTVQTAGAGENGTWIRASDGNTSGEIEAGMIVMVTEGTVYRDTQWKLTTNDPIIIGTTALTFEQNTGFAFGNISANGTAITSNAASGTVTLAAGDNVTITGNNTSKTITISASGGGGSGTAITNGTSNVDIASANANVTVSVAGTANVAVFSATGLAVSGTITGNGIATTTVSNTAPSSPSQGDIWIEDDTGTQYIYFTSGGNSQWAEMEAAASFELPSYGDANVLTYLTTGVAGNIIPAANVTYDLGSSANRWQDIWLANSTIYIGEANISAQGSAVILPANTTVGGAVVSAVPKITGFIYPGDDTAANPAGGQTILINGSNFESGCVVYLDNSVISPVGLVSSSQLSITSPAKATGTYSVYVVNPDGSTALALPGIIYSGVPAWSTAAGNIGTPYETNPFATTLLATSDSTVTYAAAPGNTLPANLSLDSSTGNLSGTVPVANIDTTYTFSVRATDAEQQDTDRQFSVTYRTDVVTWSDPANAASYTWTEGQANSVSMTATSAAGKSVSYAVQSGSLPANVAIAGNLISGTPNTVQSNTAVVIRATAATTNRFADRTLYFTVEPGVVSSVEYLVVAGGGAGGYDYGGGGGAGGFRTGNLAVSTGLAYTVTVGAGGTAGSTTNSTDGENSVFSSITSTGGGRGGYRTAGSSGGSGGGGGEGSNSGGSGTAGQGNNGGRGWAGFNSGGGGGGAGAVGSNAPSIDAGGAGGNGSTAFDGTTYAGGGGGGNYNTSTSGGDGGSGGGGKGGGGSNNGIAGTTNTGGGGGGGGGGRYGGNGGSGVVIIRYPDSFPAAASTTGSPTVTTSGGYRYYKFTGSGTITW